jgi:glycosyltransferase involved in cell wall biosynthesis
VRTRDAMMSAPPLPKVLYTSADADRQGGALRCLFDMGNEIGNWGYRPILVLSKEQGGSASADGNGFVQIYTLPLPRPRRGRSIGSYLRDIVETARSARRLARIIRRERVALVHVNEILDVYGGIAARMAGVPCVWHVRADISSWPYALRKVLPKVVAGLSSEIIAVSASVEEEVFRLQGVDTQKVSVIHDPGPDPSAFRPDLHGAAVRRELGLADRAGVVVLVAKMVEPKGHEVLIRAVPKVLASFPDAHFVIVGGDLDGAHHQRYAARLRRLPDELGVGSAVTFTGYRRDVPQLMAAADIVTHCSTHADPFPGVVLQGMALGKAVVASDIGGTREQIDDGISGILVPPNDYAALARTIVELLGDPAKRASLGRVAAARVRERFTSEAFYRRLSEAYGDLIRSGSS